MAAKKWIKIAGNILTALALVLVVYRLASIEIDYSIIFRWDHLCWVAFLALLYGVHIASIPYSWQIILHIVTGKKLPFLSIQYTFCRSNLLKYLPGNVFQYVGRNEIAVQYDLPHKEVALSTLLDVAANILGVLAVAVLCYAAGLQTGLESVLGRVSPAWLGAAAVAVLLVCVIAYKLRAFLLEKLRILFIGANLARYAFCIAYYAFFALYTGAIYLAVLTQILNVPLNGRLLFIVIGAYQLSWLLGFIMPGAPGGVGIRETVIVVLLAQYVPQDPVLLAIVMYRIINIVGDFIALLLNRVWALGVKRCRNRA